MHFLVSTRNRSVIEWHDLQRSYFPIHPLLRQMSRWEEQSQPSDLPSYEEAKFCRQVFSPGLSFLMIDWNKFFRSVAMPPSPVGTLSAKRQSTLQGKKTSSQRKIPTSGPLSKCVPRSSYRLLSYFYIYVYIFFAYLLYYWAIWIFQAIIAQIKIQGFYY